MRYVQYYNRGREVLGDRGVVILDGRNSLETSIEDAQRFNGFRRPTFEGYQILQGNSFMAARPLTEIKTLED